MKEAIIEYWLTWIFGVFGTIMLGRVTVLKHKLKKRQVTQEALIKGMKVLLYKELKRSCDTYLSMGYIPTDESDDILNENKDVYEAYTGVGGNGTGKLKYEKFKALPIKDSNN